MSGGVDSSVAAFLTKERGYDCIGATMRLCDDRIIGKNDDSACGSLSDAKDAKSVADKLSIPFHIFDFSENFQQTVIDKFVASYLAGLTPNPCIDCNKYIKWLRLFKKMEELEADFVVTGHYARIRKNENGRYMLLKGVDSSKDQSYVLFNMTQEQLAHTMLPVGEFTKSEIRSIAEQNDFINASKHDSQDICFVPDKDYAAFIERYTGKTSEPGDFVDKNGNVIGKHSGLIRYTIGQRKGLGVAFGTPKYVCDKNAEENTVTLSDEAELFTDTLIATDFNWVSIEKPDKPIEVAAKTRYSQTEQPATAYPLENGDVKVIFKKTQRAITKGQAAVLYIGDAVVGGGTIV